MDEVKPIDSNELIAEFMNGQVREQEGGSDVLLFHASWDWLMPVVEKIEAIKDEKYIVAIDGVYCCISEYGEHPIKECQAYDKKIDNVYRTVVEFIKWYNANFKSTTVQG